VDKDSATNGKLNRFQSTVFCMGEQRY